VKFKKGDTVIYPQHGACKVVATRKEDPFGSGKLIEYLILSTVIGEMTLRVPMAKVDDVGVRPPVSPDELADLVAVLAKADPRVPSNWSRRFKNHQEKLKSGDVYQVAEVVRNLAARNRDASLSAAERTMYERARVNLISEIAPALKVSTEDAESYLDDALAKGVLKVKTAAKKETEKKAPAKEAAPAPVAEKKPAEKKPAEKKVPAAKPAEKKPAAKKAAEKKAPEKKPAEKKAPAKKAAAKK
jgi:CarD family transcriptional regulator